MKNLFKIYTFLLLTLLSCSEKDAPPTEKETGKIWTVKVTERDANGKTTDYVDTHVSGTVTLSGWYERLQIHNGANVTMSDGTVWASFGWNSYSETGSAVTITVPSGATAFSTDQNGIKKGVTFNLYGTMFNLNSNLYIEGTFKAFAGSQHHVYYLFLHPGGNYYAYDNSHLEVTEDLRQPNFTTTYPNNQGKLILESCAAYVYCKRLQGWGGYPFVYGIGKVGCETAEASIGPLTGSSNIKICANNGITYTNGGSLGSGQQNCTCVVP